MSTSSRPEPDESDPARLSVGQTITVFRSRLRPEGSDDYGGVAQAMEVAVRSIPGFVDAKTFTAEDGERVTVATFADRDALEAWRELVEHREAQRRGRDEFYLEYSVQTGTCEHAVVWRRGGTGR
jgi:heme-degrading monooxygenase HmoA